MTKYEWTPEMGEISGFGGGYEKTCRDMLLAGLRWLDENPNAEPKFKGVYGLISDDNEDAKALSYAITAVCDACTGAMHQAVVSHCLYIRKNGWDDYVKRMTERGQE